MKTTWWRNVIDKIVESDYQSIKSLTNQQLLCTRNLILRDQSYEVRQPAAERRGISCQFAYSLHRAGSLLTLGIKLQCTFLNVSLSANVYGHALVPYRSTTTKPPFEGTAGIIRHVSRPSRLSYTSTSACGQISNICVWRETRCNVSPQRLALD